MGDERILSEETDPRKKDLQMLTYGISKKMMAPNSTCIVKRLKQWTVKPTSWQRHLTLRVSFNTSLLNIKTTEGHQTFDGSPNRKDRDPKKLEKKMNSKEAAKEKNNLKRKKAKARKNYNWYHQRDERRYYAHEVGFKKMESLKKKKIRSW